MEFLALDRRDVAKLAGISLASVRFDRKIPREVLERLQESSPRDMIRYGRHERLRRFVMSALEENVRAPAA